MMKNSRILLIIFIIYYVNIFSQEKEEHIIGLSCQYIFPFPFFNHHQITNTGKKGIEAHIEALKEREYFSAKSTLEIKFKNLKNYILFMGGGYELVSMKVTYTCRDTVKQILETFTMYVKIAEKFNSKFISFNPYCGISVGILHNFYKTSPYTYTTYDSPPDVRYNEKRSFWQPVVCPFIGYSVEFFKNHFAFFNEFGISEFSAGILLRL